MLDSDPHSSDSDESYAYSISTENGNKYNNQIHHFERFGWPPGWEFRNQYTQLGDSELEDLAPTDGSHSSPNRVETLDLEVSYSQVSFEYALQLA